jgi:hypothetical protein
MSENRSRVNCDVCHSHIITLGAMSIYNISFSMTYQPGLSNLRLGKRQGERRASWNNAMNDELISFETKVRGRTCNDRWRPSYLWDRSCFFFSPSLPTAALPKAPSALWTLFLPLIRPVQSFGREISFRSSSCQKECAVGEPFEP